MKDHFVLVFLFHTKEMSSELAIFMCFSYIRESNKTNKRRYENIASSSRDDVYTALILKYVFLTAL